MVTKRRILRCSTLSQNLWIFVFLKEEKITTKIQTSCTQRWIFYYFFPISGSQFWRQIKVIQATKGLWPQCICYIGTIGVAGIVFFFIYASQKDNFIVYQRFIFAPYGIGDGRRQVEPEHTGTYQTEWLIIIILWWWAGQNVCKVIRDWLLVTYILKDNCKMLQRSKD